MLSDFLLEVKKVGIESTYGDVFKGTRISDGVAVVAKFNTNPSPENNARFQRENDILYALSPHDGIIEPVTRISNGSHQHITADFYIMMCADMNFEDWLYKTQPNDFSQNLDVFKQICKALRHAHEHGYIHRDLHVHNILINTNPQNVAKLIDFGRAYDFNSGVGLSDLPAWGKFVMPPEVRFGVVNAPNSSDYVKGDIFALGIIWRCLFEKNIIPLFALDSMISGMSRFIAMHSPNNDIRNYYNKTTPEFRKQTYDEWLINNQASIDNFSNIQTTPVDLADKLTIIGKKIAAFDVEDRISSIDDILIEVERL